MLEVVRHFAAIRGKLRHDFFMQPDVHRCRVVRVAGVVQLGRELFARGEAAVEIEQFHEIDDRVAPIELLVALRRELGQDRLDIDWGSRG